jgi:hypothetical protein
LRRCVRAAPPGFGGEMRCERVGRVCAQLASKPVVVIAGREVKDALLSILVRGWAALEVRGVFVARSWRECEGGVGWGRKEWCVLGAEGGKEREKMGGGLEACGGGLRVGGDVGEGGGLVCWWLVGLEVRMGVVGGRGGRAK